MAASQALVSSDSSEHYLAHTQVGKAGSSSCLARSYKTSTMHVPRKCSHLRLALQPVICPLQTCCLRFKGALFVRRTWPIRTPCCHSHQHHLMPVNRAIALHLHNKQCSYEISAHVAAPPAQLQTFAPPKNRDSVEAYLAALIQSHSALKTLENCP
jgi:hypothetical protein